MGRCSDGTTCAASGRVSTGTQEINATVPSLRVLVAEDDQEMNAVLCEALSADGHTVLAVRTGTDALAALLNSAGRVLPDVVVTDVRMPGLTGLDLLRAMRRAGLRIPVIVITAFGHETIHREAFALGASAVLDKPFDLDELREVIASPDTLLDGFLK